MSLFESGIRPHIDKHLADKAAEKRDYGAYWSASSAGYCMRKLILERLKVPEVKIDARKTRVFEAGHIFHEWIQRVTKNAGLSIAQETELQDENLMVRGHIDDLIVTPAQGLILYDYKTQNSRAFSYQKDRPMSHFHKMQVGTYMYMIRHDCGVFNLFDNAAIKPGTKSVTVYESELGQMRVNDLSEARILKISKDDLRFSEQQLMYTSDLEKEIVGYWSTLNGYWKSKTLPSCTCADREGGFMARELYNPFFYEGKPCSAEWAQTHVDLSKWNIKE